MKLAAFAFLALGAIATPLAAQDAAPEGTAQSAAWHNQQQAALHALSREDGWHILEGGVRFRRIAGDGTGSAPTLRDTVRVTYTGSLVDGQVFDSNVGRAPATFPLARLVRGWQIAIPYMGVGDTAEIVLPMEQGYGPAGAGPIPGGATLFFTIELLGVTPARTG